MLARKFSGLDKQKILFQRTSLCLPRRRTRSFLAPGQVGLAQLAGSLHMSACSSACLAIRHCGPRLHDGSQQAIEWHRRRVQAPARRPARCSSAESSPCLVIVMPWVGDAGISWGAMS